MNASNILKSSIAQKAFRDALIRDGLSAPAATRIVELIWAMTVTEGQLRRELTAQRKVVLTRLHCVSSELHNDVDRLRREISQEVSTLKVNQTGSAIKLVGALLTLLVALVAVAAGVVQVAKALGLFT